MSDQLLEALTQQTEALTIDEQLALAARLIERARRTALSSGRKWREIRGLLAYPAVGEDAQKWVSRTRREDDDHREQALRRAA